MREPFSDEDRSLVGRCQDGDESAFEELVRKYQQTIFNLVYHNMGYRNDVEDIAQKIFAKVYFSLAKFDNHRPFFPWLYRISVNQCYDELRRAKRSKIRTFSDLNMEEVDQIDRLISQNEGRPISGDETKELHALLYKMLDKLPTQQRKAVVLRDLEYVPYNKMAQLLECSEQAVRLKVFRARTKLRRLMEKALRRGKNAKGRKQSVKPAESKA